MVNKNILLVTSAVPTSKIGSWTIMLTKVLVNNPLFFDKIISPKSDVIISGISKFEVKDSFLFKILSKKNRLYRKRGYYNTLKKHIDNKLVLNVVIFDDVNLLLAIDFFAKKDGLRNQINIIYFNRGYRFDECIKTRSRIYKAINKLVVQTKKSYEIQLQENHTIPCEVQVLPNGINSNVFYPLLPSEKSQLRKNLNFKEDTIYFLWVSQDRPKKGLSIILKAWQHLISKHTNIELLIIGTYNKVNGKQITWLERKQNDELAPYYQATDYYLFSSLCHEGQPLSLTEALKSGAKCLASNIDPILEILDNRNLGYLVDHPHFVDSWIKAINKVLEEKINFNKKNIDLLKLYDIEDWIKNMQHIIKG